MKNYSYTERGMPDDRQECQSQWISYKNFENIIEVKFVENTFHEPEYYCQDITLEELSYTDEEFDDYINNIIESKKEKANELKKKQKEEKIKKEENKLQRKLKQFEKLKLELGK